MPLKVFFSHSVGPWELASVYAIAEDAARRGMQTFVPYRDWDPGSELPARIVSQLIQAEVLVALATRFGNHQEHVNCELAQLPEATPNLLVVDEGLTIQKMPNSELIFIDRDNPARTVSEVLQRLDRTSLGKNAKNLLAWALGIGLLAALLGRD